MLTKFRNNSIKNNSSSTISMNKEQDRLLRVYIIQGVHKVSVSNRDPFRLKTDSADFYELIFIPFQSVRRKSGPLHHLFKPESVGQPLLLYWRTEERIPY